VLNSFIATAKRLRIDPFTYRGDFFERICAHPNNQLDEPLADRGLAA